MKSRKTTNFSLFRTPFFPAYWRCAWQECFTLRTLSLTAIMIAVCAILDIFFIPIVNASVLQIKFTFFAEALCTLICGPVLAIPAGLLIDTLGFFLGGGASGGYFFGYAISTMTACLIFSLFFYRARRLTVWRTAAAKASVNLIVNVLLGSAWRQIIVGKGYWYYVGLAAIKNIALLPLEVVILIIFLRRMLPLLKRAKIVSPEVEFTMTRADIIGTIIVGVVGIAALAAYVVWKLNG